MTLPLPADLEDTVDRALAEDVGTGDLTALLVPASAQCRARVITRESAVLCGTAWVDAVFRRLDPGLRVRWAALDGATVAPDQLLFEVEGPARPLLTGERTALNFLQTLSATATATRRYVDTVAGTRCRILDTRKTLPGLREAQKYAVRCGGGRNHRMGLYDMVLVKENHILAAGSIAAAVAAARRLSPGVSVEVEVESLEELEQAFAADADLVMLDELVDADLREAVRRRDAGGRRAQLEASGGVSLETVRRIAETGVDYISVGGLTKHVAAVDLSMRIEFVSGR
ncbi:MAG: carboxylating nicotinate-nucleotide diphosphorylase [Steroidobacteraceae bacterium]|nr:carboxylating nicotinate-nucleotide diphosphorylase [Steroidobacteraceae bacterium]